MTQERFTDKSKDARTTERINIVNMLGNILFLRPPKNIAIFISIDIFFCFVF